MATAVSEVMHGNPYLKSLNLADSCFIGVDPRGHGVPTLQPLREMCTHMRVHENINFLNLAGNGLTAEQAQSVCELLMCRKLGGLVLSRNPLGDKGAAVIADALTRSAQGSKLNHLELAAIDCGKEGLKAVGKACSVGNVQTLVMYRLFPTTLSNDSFSGDVPARAAADAAAGGGRGEGARPVGQAAPVRRPLRHQLFRTALSNGSFQRLFSGTRTSSSSTST